MLTRPKGCFRLTGGRLFEPAINRDDSRRIDQQPSLSCGLHDRFGGLTAVSGLDLAVEKAGVVGLIGPTAPARRPSSNLIKRASINPPGKNPLQRPFPCRPKPPRDYRTGRSRARSRTSALFPSLTVFDNVRVAFHLHLVSGISHALWRGRAFREEEKAGGRASAGDCSNCSTRPFSATRGQEASLTETSGGFEIVVPWPPARLLLWIRPAPG